jgi:hypothetical protein
MRSDTMRRVLSVTAVTGLTILALSVVAGTVVESRGPGADQLPQVSLPAVIDAGVVVAEVTSPSVPQAPSTLAPTTTTVPVPAPVTTVGRTRSLSAVGSRVTRPTRNTAAPTTTYAPLAITQVPSSATTERDPIPRPVYTATVTTVPHTWVTIAPTKPTDRTTTTIHLDSTTKTTDHVVVPPTVRESDDDD